MACSAGDPPEPKARSWLRPARLGVTVALVSLVLLLLQVEVFKIDSIDASQAGETTRRGSAHAGNHEGSKRLSHATREIEKEVPSRDTKLRSDKVDTTRQGPAPAGKHEGSKRQKHATQKTQKKVPSKGTELPTDSFVEPYTTPWETARPMLGGKRPIFAITPTYRRIMQLQQITSVAQPMMLDGGIYWVVIEDAPKPTASVRKFLNKTGLPFSHLAATSPKSKRFRGANQRNAGLALVESLGVQDGLIYFADDDNAYDYRLFDMLRELKRDLGFLATGFTGSGNFERCLVNKTGAVTGFATNWGRDREIAVDMAGFVMQTSIFKRHPGWRIVPLDNIKQGHMESTIVTSLGIDKAQVQPLGNCTRVLFWHLPKPPDWAREMYKKQVEGSESQGHLASFPALPP